MRYKCYFCFNELYILFVSSNETTYGCHCKNGIFLYENNNKELIGYTFKFNNNKDFIVKYFYDGSKDIFFENNFLHFSDFEIEFIDGLPQIEKIISNLNKMKILL